MSETLSGHAGIARLAQEMERHGNERDAPARAVMAMLGDRWTTLILLVLDFGEWRHADLRRVLCELSSEQSISQRVLTLKLRTLEREGFVLRTVTGDVPPKVSYRLSELGCDLSAKARGLVDWINGHAPQIHAARQRFDCNDA